MVNAPLTLSLNRTASEADVGSPLSAAVGARKGWLLPMLFLMNDRVLQLDESLTASVETRRFDGVTPAFAVKLGQELYSEQPMLHREAPERARRLALLLLSKAPEVNAALFVAPQVGCNPDQVITRFASLPVEVMASLYVRDKASGGLTPVQADREVWRRLAA